MKQKQEACLTSHGSWLNEIILEMVMKYVLIELTCLLACVVIYIHKI